MADKLRNEVAIQFAGEERTMRASFGAIRGIESQLGNLIPLIQSLSKGDVGITQTAVIIAEGLKGFGDTRLTFDQVGDALMSQGLNSVSKSVGDFLRIALEGVPLEETGGA